MPQKYAIKAANIGRKKSKSKAKLVEWEARAHSQEIKDVPVEVSTIKSQPKLLCPQLDVRWNFLIYYTLWTLSF